MKHISEQLTKTQGTSCETARPSLPANWVGAIFSKMQARYGEQWSRQWATSDTRKLAMTEWGNRLADLTPEQLKRGMDCWRQDWPPNVETFRKACIGEQEGLSHNTAAYKRFRRALPKPKAEPDVVKAAIAEMREKIGR